MRPAFEALWNLDLAFADVVATTSDPAIGAIRMAWWRERLETLDRGEAAPAEPRLKAAEQELVSRGITGLELSKLEDAWLPMLSGFPWGNEVAEAFALRGQILFGVGGRLLGDQAHDAEQAGALWSLVDGAQHCSDVQSRENLIAAARAIARDLPGALPAAVRPLTILGALAAYDLRRGGRLGRVGAALAHRLRGSMPHG